MTFEPLPLPEDELPAVPERETLEGFLEYFRVVIERKLVGVSLEDASRPMVPSGTNLLGIVKHLGYVERGWFQMGFAGEPALPVPWTDEDPDADFRIEPGETIESVVGWYRRQWERSVEISSAAESLDQIERRTGPRGGHSLRWILIHMIEETARHAGHMDILREQIDGALGD
jgi:hypothetical protein